ncbi:unnamed protein product [Calypogeia fissa]
MMNLRQIGRRYDGACPIAFPMAALSKSSACVSYGGHAIEFPFAAPATPLYSAWHRPPISLVVLPPGSSPGAAPLCHQRPGGFQCCSTSLIAPPPPPPLGDSTAAPSPLLHSVCCPILHCCVLMCIDISRGSLQPSAYICPTEYTLPNGGLLVSDYAGLTPMNFVGPIFPWNVLPNLVGSSQAYTAPSLLMGPDAGGPSIGPAWHEALPLIGAFPLQLVLPSVVWSVVHDLAVSLAAPVRRWIIGVTGVLL